jgi:hypothetical protein
VAFPAVERDGLRGVQTGVTEIGLGQVPLENPVAFWTGGAKHKGEIEPFGVDDKLILVDMFDR